MDSLSNLRNSLDDTDHSRPHPDGSDAMDFAAAERRRRQKQLGDQEQDLTKQFKAAALQLTTLYRSSLASNTSSYEAGYRHALSHVLEVLVRSPVALDEHERQPSSSDAANLLEQFTPEQGLQRLRWLSGYLQRRIEAMSTAEDDDDENATPVPSTSSARAQQAADRGRSVRFEGSSPAVSLRQPQLQAGGSSPLVHSNSLPSPLASASRFASQPTSAVGSPRLSPGFGTPVTATAAPSADRDSIAAAPSRPQSALAAASTPAQRRQGDASTSAMPASRSESGLSTGNSAGGTKRSRGEFSHASLAGTMASDMASPTIPGDSHRRRISGRKAASGLSASSVSSNASPSLGLSDSPSGGPTMGLHGLAPRTGSFDFKLPQSVGVRSVDFSHHGMVAAAAAAATAAKLNASRRQPGGAAANSPSAKRPTASVTHPAGGGLRRGRSGRLRAAGGLRAGTTAASASSSNEHDMATDSEDDWVDDEDEDEGAPANGGALQATPNRATRSRGGGGGGRTKRRRTGRTTGGAEGNQEGQGGRDAGAGDVDM